MPATQITTILLNDIYVCAKVPKIGLFLPRASTVEVFPSDADIAGAVTVDGVTVTEFHRGYTLTTVLLRD